MSQPELQKRVDSMSDEQFEALKLRGYLGCHAYIWTIDFPEWLNECIEMIKPGCINRCNKREARN